MKTSLIKVLAVAFVVAAPTGAFAASYDGMSPGATLASTNPASVDHAGGRAKPKVERTEKVRVLDERKGEMRTAPLDDPYAHWDANMNAG
ncbi:hypothetical protein IHQ68_04720 [Chelatococcus sambhunathii]|uniref:DUF680 domain-containing protein n=1 Tax=Chelatococcus sambhunathii TaxID=363953 RepID=A0ABU1DD19_9HYPH|nr:hypothetical protein [Chelatococcus sambhunathii]MDR4305929.1 hypothetical protein [Chelatococcus sambhunathii]